ncbi:MAG: M28 family peptidase [Deltaproteobacteria bacterium]|nr:M28 family peptidase [Deltaproteobacteria bacterium]
MNIFNKLLKSVLSILLTVLVICSALVAAVWLVIAQPTWEKNNPSDKRVDAKRLEKHVRTLSEEFHPRNYRNVKNLNRTAAYIMDHFNKAGARFTSFQEFKRMGNTYKNVIAHFGPDEGQRIIVGAHYDTVIGTPGADDNTSGVAGLIELAYLLGISPIKGHIELVAYTLEEPPFFATNHMGSAVHAEFLAAEEIEVKLMISLEMIGYFTDEEDSQIFPMPLLKLIYPSRGNYILIVSNLNQREITKKVKSLMRGTTNLPVHSINAPSIIAGVDFSDHRNYWNNGYEAVMVTDTSFYRNRAYHKENDSAGRLDYEKMAKVVIGIFETLKRLNNK